MYVYFKILGISGHIATVRAWSHGSELLFCGLSHFLHLPEVMFDFFLFEFRFASARDTDMATSPANDVFFFCTKRELLVSTCYLDAEGAFDAVPHFVL